MNTSEFPYGAKEITSSITIKAKAIKWILDSAYYGQPENMLHKIHVTCPSRLLQDNDCKNVESIVAVYETEILYYYHPYSEPGAPSGLQHFQVKQLENILNLVKPHLLKEYLIERYSNEIDIDPKTQRLLEKYNLLLLEQKKASQQDIKKFLEPIPEYFKFFILIFDKNTAQLSQYLNQKLLNEINVKSSEVTDYIDAINLDNKENIKSLSSYISWKLMLSASSIRRKEGLVPYLAPSYNNRKLLTYENRIKLHAKNYYQKRFDVILASAEISRVGSAIFQSPIASLCVTRGN